jgi:hypothetical protein
VLRWPAPLLEGRATATGETEEPVVLGWIRAEVQAVPLVIRARAVAIETSAEAVGLTVQAKQLE